MTVVFIASSSLPTPWGVFDLHGFEDTITGKEHIALTFGEVSGEVSGDEPVLARVHSECLTGDALFSMRCDCGFQLQTALENIANEGRGLLLYLKQEGRGIGLINKIKAYHLQDRGADTVEANEKLGFDADLRDYTMCQTILAHLKVRKLRLMTNNPVKINALTKLGLEIVERVPLQTGENSYNEKYLATKAGKMGHMLVDRNSDH